MGIWCSERYFVLCNSFFYCVIHGTSCFSPATADQVEAASGGVSSQESSQESSQDEFESPIPTVPADEFVTLRLPKKDLMKTMSALGSRLQMSKRQQTAYAAGLIKAGGGSISDVTLSVSSTQRQSRQGVTEKTKELRDDFQSNQPARVVFHWDGKVIKYQNKTKKDDHLAIVVSAY